MCITSFADLPDSVSDCRRRTRPASAWNAGETGGEEDAAHPGRNATWGKLRDVERPACLQRQTGACRSCGMGSYCHPAGMRNRTERHEPPTEVSRLSRRGQESRAQSIDRITQREGAYPCWAGRSESSARSYAAVPGPGMDPPGFLRGKRWESLKLNSVSPLFDAAGNSAAEIDSRDGPEMGQRPDGA